MFQATDGNWYYYLDQAAQVATSPTAQLINPGFDLQSIAYARALAMATQQFMSHAIGNAPGIPAGVSEGIGYGPGPAPATCILPGSVVADAAVVSANGLTYRVRFFR